MTDYKQLILVRRDDIIDLFKTGKIYPLAAVTFDCRLEELPSKPKTVNQVLDKLPLNEYSINFFLLFAKTEKKDIVKNGLLIEDLLSIIPLDEEAKRIGLNLTPEVNLYSPIFSDNFYQWQIRSAVENSIRGVSNIERIFGYEDLWKSIKKFSIKNLPDLVNVILDESGTYNPASIWEFLLSYSRTQTYPKDIRGYFLDTMSVVSAFKNKGFDNKDQKNTTTGKEILELDNPKYHSLVNLMLFSPKLSQIAEKAYKGFLSIAPLYFILLDYFSDTSEDGSMVKDLSVKEFISSVKKHYEESALKPALLLLGITLGQASTYKILYSVKKEDYTFLK